MKVRSIRTLLATLFVLAGTAASPFSQANPEVVIRQGDTIVWVAASGSHKVNFGASGTTSVTDIGGILEFNPPLVPNPASPGESESKATSATLQSAIVKEDKATVGKTFVFTCGFHKAPMLSIAFRVAPKEEKSPARTYRIVGEAAAGVFHWHLHIDTTPS